MYVTAYLEMLPVIQYGPVFSVQKDNKARENCFPRGHLIFRFPPRVVYSLYYYVSYP